MTSSEYFTEVANPAAAEIGNRIHQQYEELVSSLAQVEKYATRTQAALAEGPAHVFFVAPDQRDAGVSAALEAAAGGQS
jgi:hypothetical protein